MYMTLLEAVEHLYIVKHISTLSKAITKTDV